MRSHGVARFRGRGTKRILLLAHMDTVYQRGMLAQQPFRVDGDRVVFIEANANSQMSRRARSTDFASIGYDKFVDKIVKLALAR